LAPFSRYPAIFALNKKLLRSVDDLRYPYRKMRVRPAGTRAARLRHRKFELARRFRLPEAVLDLLPGSLSQTARRCGKLTCHCRTGEGHPSWYLTFMVDGRKHVERIPAEWVAEVQQRVQAGRAFKEAVAEVFAANAQLLVLWRQQTGA
jgi:hypothetical protein